MQPRAMAVQTQKDWRPGIWVKAPTPKANTSVKLVTVTLRVSRVTINVTCHVSAPT